MKTYRAAIIGCGWRSTGLYPNFRSPYQLSIYPFSHAQAFVACERTEFVAAADFQPDTLERVGNDYGVPADSLYTDFREMIDKEKPDIISIGTQQEQRAEITIHAADAGVKAIYAEKPLTSSLAEAEAMAQAVERNGVAFNLGANRRWAAGYEIVRELANSGELGDLKTIISYNMDPIFISGSHWFDLINWINCDRRAVSVQATLTRGGDAFEGDVMTVDPGGHGVVHYENGVTAYCLTTPRGSEKEVICERGAISIIGNGSEWRLRRLGQHADPGQAGPGTSEDFRTSRRAAPLWRSSRSSSPPSTAATRRRGAASGRRRPATSSSSPSWSRTGAADGPSICRSTATSGFSGTSIHRPRSTARTGPAG